MGEMGVWIVRVVGVRDDDTLMMHDTLYECTVQGGCIVGACYLWVTMIKEVVPREEGDTYGGRNEGRDE